jgi:transcription elongation factor GreA
VIGPAATHTGSEEALITAEGYARLRDELEVLRLGRRQELAERVLVAREDGDLADNPDLFDALEEQAALERRIASLEEDLASARITDGNCVDGKAGIGTRIRVRHLDTGETFDYELVGAIEANPADGRISVAAPVGRALAGRRAGALVEVETPRGRARLQLLAVAAANVTREGKKAA